MTPKLKKLTAGIGGAALLTVGAATVDVVPTETFWVGIEQVQEDGTKVCYNKFYEPDGDVQQTETPCEEYRRVSMTPDYPAPAQQGRVPLLSPKKAQAIVGFDATANSGDQASVTSVSYSHTTTGSNLALYVGVSMQDTTDAERDVTSATYNSVALTEVRRQNNNTMDLTAELWRLVNPSTGSNTVTVDYAGTVTDSTVGSVSFTKVDQTTPEETAGGSGACGTSDPHLQSVTPGTYDSYILGVLVDDEISIGQLSPDTPLGIQRWEIDMGSFMASGDTVEATSTNVHLLAWDAAVSRDYCVAAVSVKPNGIALMAQTAASGAADVTTAAINTTGADFIVIGEAIDDAYSTTPTDSKGNTWSQAANSYTRGNVRVRLWYTVPTSVGTGHTFTAPGVPAGALFVAAFRGVAQTSPEDQINGANNFSTTIQPGSITPTQNDELIISVLGINADGSPMSINSSFVETNEVAFNTGVSYGGTMAYLIQTTAAAVNPTWTRTNTNGNAAMQVSFKIPSAPPAVAAINKQSIIFFESDDE